MGRKWSNRGLAGALHFVTANCYNRKRIFKSERYCLAFLQTVAELRRTWPFKLVAYVLMPDHLHLIINPRDGKITNLTAALKGQSARRIIDASPEGTFLLDKPPSDGSTHQVWQESFKALPLWSDWMIWQKINYIHNNAVKARLVESAVHYRWSSFAAFYHRSGGESLPVDKDWWWPDDVRKLSVAMGEWDKEILENELASRKKK